MAFDGLFVYQSDGSHDVIASIKSIYRLRNYACEVRKYTPMIGNNGLAMSSNTWWLINIKTSIKT